MTDTPLLGLPLLAAAQAQKHVTHNEALSLLDGVVQLSVIERNRTVPPSTPNAGERYLLSASPTGAFTGQGGKLALYDAAGWHFVAPKAGWRAFVTSENLMMIYDGTLWREMYRFDSATGALAFPSGVMGVASSPNLLINGDCAINQRGFAGGSLSAASYGFDRWKAGAGGCTLSRASDGVITLNGALEQVIEAPRLASRTVTLSVDDPSGDLPVDVGSQSATITAGTGRRSVTLNLTSGDNGDILVRLYPASSMTFSRIKLEVGGIASAWQEPDFATEYARCLRYYEVLLTVGAAGWLSAPALRLGSNTIDAFVHFSAKRTTPSLITSAPSFSSGAQASGNQISFYNYVVNAWSTITGTISVSLLAGSAHQNSAMLRLLASTSYNGASGQAGALYLGAGAFIALSAEL
jgi:hypothetical protein